MLVLPRSQFPDCVHSPGIDVVNEQHTPATVVIKVGMATIFLMKNFG